MSSFWTFWVKSIGYSTLVIGTGVFLLKTVGPPPLSSTDLDRKQDHDQKWVAITKMIKKNTESDRPAWDIKWYFI